MQNNPMEADLFGFGPTQGGEAPVQEATIPAATIPASIPSIPPHIQFIEARKKLLSFERDKLAGKDVDLKEVQRLVYLCSDLMAQIQTSTTGPKKKIVDGEVTEAKKKSPPKAKKAS